MPLALNPKFEVVINSVYNIIVFALKFDDIIFTLYPSYNITCNFLRKWTTLLRASMCRLTMLWALRSARVCGSGSITYLRYIPRHKTYNYHLAVYKVLDHTYDISMTSSVTSGHDMRTKLMVSLWKKKLNPDSDIPCMLLMTHIFLALKYPIWWKREETYRVYLCT